MAEFPFFIELLNKSHERSSFHCGESSLDDYFKRYSRQNMENDSALIYVAVQPDSSRVCGFFTLSAARIKITDFPFLKSRSWPRDVPAIHLGRIAVDSEFQGQGLGYVFLGAAIETSIEAAEKIGIAAIELWSLNDNLLRFYQKFEFFPLLDDSKHLVLPLANARKLFL